MAYFPNGTSGMLYEEQYCWNCAHWNDGACPIMDAHNLYNYDQLGDGKGAQALRTVLSLLIPETKDGLGAEQCSMFRALADPEAEWAEQRRLAAQPTRYEAAMSELRRRPVKPLPKNDPYAFQARVMDALIGDILDINAKGTPRLDALRQVSKNRKSA